MPWYKWMMLAVTGFAPVLAYAEEPADRPAPQQPVQIRIRTSEGESQPIGPKRDVVFQPGQEQVIVVREGDEKEAPRPGQPVQPGWQIQQGHGGLTFALEGKREKAAYLGLSASPVPPVLRTQLGLPAGMGLVVDFVAPDSPAAKAGLKQYDILQKLDDQLIVNQEQLAVLVRSHKPGDEIKLGVIQESKPATLNAKLAEHEVEPLGAGGWELNVGKDALRQMLPEPHARPLQWGDRNVKFWVENNGPTSITLISGDHAYTVNTDPAGHKTLVAKDKNGKETFTGPIDTPQQREKLPAELKATLDTIEKLTPKLGGGVGLKGPEGRPTPENKKPHEKDADEK